MAIRFGVSSTVKNRLPRYSNFWDGTAVYSPFSPTGSYDALATYTVGSGGIASIEFAGIPNTYSHLQIRGIVRSSGVADLRFQVDGDTGSNYASHTIYGYGTAIASGNDFNSTAMAALVYNGVPTGTSIFGAVVMDILDYSSTTKFKTFRTLSGVDNNGSGDVDFGSGLWRSTSAIDSIKIYLNSSRTIQQYSQFSLYGVK